MLICYLSITKRKKIIVVGFQGIESLIKKWRQRMKNDYIEVKFEKGLFNSEKNFTGKDGTLPVLGNQLLNF